MKIRRAAETLGTSVMFYGSLIQFEDVAFGTHYAAYCVLAMLASWPLAIFWRATEPSPLL